ncbi:MAG: S-layer homology domain-containing protein [Oscillospiraceae bacterium]|nr:S-layer homology domain-containing protein [Oscillospiraceae bacterium]
MRVKKLLSVLLVCVMLLGLFPASAFAASYSDTQGHWAQKAIERWSDYGIVTGDGQGFRPNDSMTRAEAATVFSRLFGLNDAVAKTSFTDVAAKDWFYEAVNKCVNAGIMNGVGDNMMNPNGTMTREMLFVMFARALGLKEQSSTKGLSADGDSWANGYINALTDRGYVRGMDGKVNALANIDRASVMALLDQTISQYVNTSGTTTLNAASGIVLVNAKNVVLTGTTAADVVIAQGADGSKVDFVKATVTGTVTAQAANAAITSDKDSKITTPVINGANTTYNSAAAPAVSGGNSGAGGSGDEEPYDNITAADGEGGGSGKTANDSADGISGVTFDKPVKITSAVGNGTVTLSNVTFKDNLIVEGGGSNSIKLINCTFDEGKGIIVNKSGGETPRIELTGTPVDSIKSENSDRPVIIEATDTASAVKKVESSSPITLQGKTQVTEELKTTGSTVTIASGSAATVEKLTTTGTVTVTANGGTIKSVEPESGSVTVGGASQGAVQAVTTTGAAVTISTTVANVTASDANITVAGGTVTEELKVTSSSGKTASVTLSDGANVAKVDVSGDGTNNISSSGTDAGRIGEIATTASITVNAANVAIDTIAVTAATGDTAGTAKTITVAAGTVSTVNASAPTTVDGSGSIMDVQANDVVKIASDAVKKVTVNTEKPVELTNASEDKVEIAVNTSDNVTIVTNSIEKVSISAANDSVTVGEIKTAKTVADLANEEKVTTAVVHIHKWGTPVVAEATCTAGGSRVYTCVAGGCTDTPATKTETIPALGHDWVVDTITPATCKTEGSISYKCTHDTHDSSVTKSKVIPVDPTAHSVASDAQWVKTNADYHWHECQHDGEHQVDKAKHTFNMVVSNAKRVYTCSVCGYEYDEALPADQATLTGVVGSSGTTITNMGARGYTPGNVTITVTSTEDFASAAAVADASALTLNETNGAYENDSWSVSYGSTNLVIKSVAINGKTATFTFEAAKDSSTNAIGPTRGTLKITAKAAASGSEEITKDSNTLMFTVPAVPDVTALEVVVDKTGAITVAGDASNVTFAKATYKFYLVDSLTQTTGKGDDAVTTSILSGLTVASKATNVSSKLTTGFDEKITETTGENGAKLLNVPSTKANNGKYLVVARYTEDQYLDAIGVSNALALIGETPAELKVAVDVVGTTTVKELKATEWKPVSSGITYYQVNALPAFAWDTLITKTDLETSGGNYYLGAGTDSIGTLNKSDVASDLYVIAVKFADGATVGSAAEKVVEAYGVSGKVVIKDIDDVIDEGIRAVNAKTNDYATLSLKKETNVVTVAIKDGAKMIGTPTDGVYADIINTLIAKLDVYKGPFQIAKIGGQNGGSSPVEDLTLGLGEAATTASAITTFVHALFPDAGGNTEIRTLAGTTIKLTLKGSDHDSLGEDYEYTLKFEAAEFEGALDQALNAQLAAINEAISTYGTVELAHNANAADTVAVTITDGSVLIGKVKTDVVDKLAAALTGFDTTDPKTWGTTTLSDAKNAGNTLNAAAANEALVTDFVAKLQYDSDAAHTLQSVVGNGIKGLDGKSVTIKVTSESDSVTKEAAYTFTFALDFEKAVETAITTAIGDAGRGITQEISSYATIALNAEENAISVNITNGETQIGTVYSAVADNLVSALADFGTNYGGVTLKDAKNSDDKGTASSALDTNSAVAGFVKALKTGNSEETLGTLLTNNAQISALNEKSVQITVTDTANSARTATFTFSFTVSAQP